MLENEIKVVNKLINEGKRYFVSENEIHEFCRNFNASYSLVIAILENKYNAKYESPFDSHCCGNYRFDNPNLQKEEHFILNSLFKNKTKIYSPLSISANNKYLNYLEKFAEEILRLDDKVETSLEDIMKALKEKKAFIGEERIWFITSEMDY